MSCDSRPEPCKCCFACSDCVVCGGGLHYRGPTGLCEPNIRAKCPSGGLDLYAGKTWALFETRFGTFCANGDARAVGRVSDCGELEGLPAQECFYGDGYYSYWGVFIDCEGFIPTCGGSGCQILP